MPPRSGLDDFIPPRLPKFSSHRTYRRRCAKIESFSRLFGRRGFPPLWQRLKPARTARHCGTPESMP